MPVAGAGGVTGPANVTVTTLLTGASWSPRLATPAKVTYGFLTSAPSSDQGIAGFTPLSPTDQSIVGQALNAFAAVADITFTPVPSGGTADMLFGLSTQAYTIGLTLPNEGDASSTPIPFIGADIYFANNTADVTSESLAPSGNSTVMTASYGALVFLGSGAASVGSLGADTIVGGTGAATVSAAASSPLVFALGGPLQFIAGTGASTVVSGGVATTLFGGAGPTLLFSDGPTQYVGAGGIDTVVGLGGVLSVQGGTGGGVFFGGTAGGNVITAGAGPVTAFGAAAGDVLTATGSASDLFAGGAGAETLTGAGSTGANTFFAGFGNETLIGGGGNTALAAGAGAELLTGGSGLTLFLFVNGRTAGAADTIAGWNPAHDFVKLAGYATSTASVLANATVANGAATIVLSDGTHVTFAGVTQLNAASFT